MLAEEILSPLSIKQDGKIASLIPKLISPVVFGVRRLDAAFIAIEQSTVKPTHSKSRTVLTHRGAGGCVN